MMKIQIREFPESVTMNRKHVFIFAVVEESGIQ